MAGKDGFAEGQPTVAPTAIYNHWKDFDLETLRTKLDEKGLAIAESQEGSIKSRKQLAEKTKEFKRTVAPEVFKQFAPLLKAYQEEVDALTTRAKLGESAFLEVFKQLYEAPDPAPAIAHGLEIASKAAELEAHAAKMAQELSEFKAESKELKNQDLTIRKLEEKVRGLEAEVSEKEREIEAARMAAAAELEARNADEARAREERLEAELQRAEAALEAMRRMHQTTQAQLFSVQAKGEEEAAAARAEAELVAMEVDRAQERLVLLAQERDALLEKVSLRKDASSTNDEGSSDDGTFGSTTTSTAAVAALRDELKVQRDLAARLQSELATVVRSTESEQSSNVAKIAGLQSSLQATEAHAAALEAELAGRPTVQELEEAKHQIRVLNAIVHNTVGEEELDGSKEEDTRVGSTTSNKGKVGSLESALLDKNRHLEHKLTMTRLELSEAQSSVETATAKVAELEGDLERSRALVARLEEDLLAAERAAEANTPGEARNGTADDGADRDVLNRTLSSSAEDLNGGAGEQTMVGVLSAQRDRLRARVHELESATAAAAQNLAKAKQDVAAARADNVALVEQLRYVQGYGKNGADVEAANKVVNRYLTDYENQINPLNDFRSREREARRKALSVQDRAAVALGSALVGGSRIAKSAILVYAFLLHLIAFIVLAGVGHKNADRIDALEEMCAQLKPAGGGSTFDGTDPVVGSGLS